MSLPDLLDPDDDLVALIRVGLNRHVDTVVSREDATRRREREARKATQAADAERVQQSALEQFFRRTG